jgi:hypothetical protein
MTYRYTFKDRAHALVDSLEDDATWKDLAAEIAVVQDIVDGLTDSEAGAVTDNAQVRLDFGLTE